MSIEELYPPSASFSAQAHVKSMEEYRELFREARQDPDKFWGEIAEREVHWFQKWTEVLKWDPPSAQR
jgi:acetyl-CoA synthetase